MGLRHRFGRFWIDIPGRAIRPYSSISRSQQGSVQGPFKARWPVLVSWVCICSTSKSPIEVAPTRLEKTGGYLHIGLYTLHCPRVLAVLHRTQESTMI